jgi:D-3-phosphoglycerate dehydrogenase / 2-oxoglutarate reductase
MAQATMTKTGTYKVLVCDDLAEEGLKLFREQKNFETVVKVKQPLEELKKLIADADACVVRSGTQITAEVIGAAKKLKVIGRAGVGLDNVDLEAASKRGIVVINTPGGNTISAAELAFCLLMSLARNIPEASNSTKRGEWERKKFTGVELDGKTLGVLGLGRIGGEVAKRAQAFRMRVIAYDPFLRADRAQAIGVEAMSLEEVLKNSDFITLHLPLTAENKNMIGEKQFGIMKKGVRIVNCARGGLIDEKALAKAIQAGQVAGAGLDVFEQEPPPKDHELFKLPQIIVTPHQGASTEEAQVAVAVDVAQSIIDYLAGRGSKNAVNIPFVDPEVLEQIKPYLFLGEKMGLFAAQLLEGQLMQVDIHYSGQAAECETTPISVSILKGLLTPILAESVNYVNASVLAKERGIKVTESKSSTAAHYANLVQLDIRTDKKTTRVAGTVISREDTRIVMIDNYDVEVMPDGFILMISNNDVPGIVGQLGTLLGQNNVNIAGMTLGRDVPGGQARAIFKIDSEISEAAMKQIRQSKNILDVKLIRL